MFTKRIKHCFTQMSHFSSFIADSNFFSANARRWYRHTGELDIMGCVFSGYRWTIIHGNLSGDQDFSWILHAIDEIDIIVILHHRGVGVSQFDRFRGWISIRTVHPTPAWIGSAGAGVAVVLVMLHIWSTLISLGYALLADHHQEKWHQRGYACADHAKADF